MTEPKEYGKALFLLTEERGTTEKVFAELGMVRQLFSENPDYLHLLDTPALPSAEKNALIDIAFSKTDTDIRSFLKILSEKHAVYVFGRCFDEYSALRDESRGIERVEAITAIPMGDEQKERLRKKLEQLTGKTVVLKNTVDSATLGGCILRYAGKQLDGSLSARLASFEKSLHGAIV